MGFFDDPDIQNEVRAERLRIQRERQEGISRFIGPENLSKIVRKVEKNAREMLVCLGYKPQYVSVTDIDVPWQVHYDEERCRIAVLKAIQAVEPCATDVYLFPHDAFGIEVKFSW